MSENYEWCMACDGEGMVDAGDGTSKVCDACGGRGHHEKKKEPEPKKEKSKDE